MNNLEIKNLNKAVDYIPKLEVLMVDSLTTKEVFALNPKTTAHRHRAYDANLVTWGQNDSFPYDVDQLLYNDADAPVIIENKVNFLLGQGIEPFEMVNTDGVITTKVVNNDKINKWLEINEHHFMKQTENNAKNLEMYGNYFLEYLYNFGGQISGFISHDCHNIRPYKRQEGNFFIPGYGISVNAAELHLETKVVPVPNFETKDFNKNGYKYIFHGKNKIPGQPYFGVPVWIGAWKNLKLTAMVVNGQLAALENGWNIKYKLSVHESYYADCEGDPLAIRAKKKALADELNSVLTGVDNNNKSLVIDMVGEYGAQHWQDTVKIESIDNNKENAMQTKLLESKNLSAPRSFNIDPELSGIVVGSNLSSGSEIRNKYNLHIALKTPTPRRILLEPLKHIGDSLGWPKNVRWRFKDLVLAKLDDNKTGISNETI